MSEIYHGSWRFRSDRFKPVYGEAWSDEDLDELAAAEEAGQDVPDLFIQVGAFGKSLADFMVTQLENCNFSIRTQFADDWAHILELEHNGPEAIQIACTNENTLDIHVVQARVTAPIWTTLFKKSSLTGIATRLETEISNILRSEKTVSELEYSS